MMNEDIKELQKLSILHITKWKTDLELRFPIIVIMIVMIIQLIMMMALLIKLSNGTTKKLNKKES